MLVTAAALDALRTQFRADFNTGFQGYKPTWGQVATYIASSTQSNTYGWLRDFPRLREWIGDKVVNSLAEGAYAIANRDFEDTVGVKRKNIQDDVLGIYSPMMQGLGQSAAEFPDELVWGLLAAGFDTPCWDGNNFFDSEHPIGATGTFYSNVVAGGGAPWFLMDTTRPLKPLIYQERQKPTFVAMTDPMDEAVFMRGEYRYTCELRANAGFGFPQLAFASELPLIGDNYSSLRQAMTSQVGETGRKLNIKPNLCVVGPSNRAAAKQLFQAALIVGGGDNIFYKDVDVLEVPWLE
jgi:phage major head subunit gpT-like protein